MHAKRSQIELFLAGYKIDARDAGMQRRKLCHPRTSLDKFHKWEHTQKIAKGEAQEVKPKKTGGLREELAAAHAEIDELKKKHGEGQLDEKDSASAMADWIYRTVSERKFETIIKLVKEKWRAKNAETPAPAPAKPIRRGARL